MNADKPPYFVFCKRCKMGWNSEWERWSYCPMCAHELIRVEKKSDGEPDWDDIRRRFMPETLFVLKERKR